MVPPPCKWEITLRIPASTHLEHQDPPDPQQDILDVRPDMWNVLLWIFGMAGFLPWNLKTRDLSPACCRLKT